MKYIENEIKIHPNLQEEDLVKLIYQRVYGPSHILNNLEKAKEYLYQEINNLPTYIYDNIEIGGNLIRVDLHYVSDIDSFYDILIKTAQKKKGTAEEYHNEINELINFIKCNKLSFNTDYIMELAKNNKPVHHSNIYNDLYKPHYRIIDLDLYNKLFI